MIGIGFSMPAFADDRVVVSSTFDADLDGWKDFEPAVIAWSKTGGNKGGCLQFTDADAGADYLIAPSKFLSPAVNYKKYNGKGYFIWQEKIVSQTGATQGAAYTVTISGPGGTATFTGGVPSPNDSAYFKYVSIVAPLSQASWVIKSGNWSAILTNVTSIQLNIDALNTQTEVEDVDNIAFVATTFIY